MAFFAEARKLEIVTASEIMNRASVGELQPNPRCFYEDDRYSRTAPAWIAIDTSRSSPASGEGAEAYVLFRSHWRGVSCPVSRRLDSSKPRWF